MQVRWISFDLKTGRRGPEVRTRTLGKVERMIGEYRSTTIDVLCWDEEKQQPVPGWQAATQQGATVLAAVNAATEEILWGGYVTRRPNKLTSAWVTANITTLEGYFDRRYVEDHTWTDVDQAVIFAGLVGDASSDGPTFVVDCPTTGIRRDRTYLRSEDKKVLSALTELMGVEDGVEFTVDLQWTDDAHTAIRYVARGRRRLGTASERPEVVFQMPGNIIDGEFLEDYSDEHGANDVLAVSSGEGEVRPESAHQTAILPTWPKFEKRISPSTSITDVSTLNAHARAELAQTWNGLQQLTIEAHLDLVPSLSTWSIGDDVGVFLTCPRFPAVVTADGTKEPGYFDTPRCLGWTVDFDAHRFGPVLVSNMEVPA